MLTRLGYGRHQAIAVRCDGKGCTLALHTGMANVEDAKTFAHTRGWLIRVDHGIHTHLCRGCRAKMENKSE